MSALDSIRLSRAVDPVRICLILNKEGVDDVYVGSLDDVIASKRAANRPKDQCDLPYLEFLRDQRGQ